jgi:hypothetical protein
VAPTTLIHASICVSDLDFCSKVAGEDILGSTNEEVVSVLSTFTASGGMFASLNLLQAFNSQLCLKWSILMCLDIRFL